MLDRRTFMAALLAPFVVIRQNQHPDPRPGIDARHVLTPQQLASYGEGVIDVFNKVREMPQIADGLRCFCGCASREGMRSLLSCFEAGGMAPECEICKSEARLAHRRFKEGQTLAQIRRAVEARYA